MSLEQLRAVDPEIADLIVKEERRERDVIRLIPSENYVSHAVLAATGSVLTNKYSEGYPGKRYYEGQQIIDVIETLAIDRAKALFHAEHANVQPYSGSPVNLAVYLAFLQPGDTVMGMGLPAGGHLMIEIPDPECHLGRLLGRFWVPWFQPQHQHLLSVARLERHRQAAQVFIPLGAHRFIVVVAPGDAEPDWRRVEAFLTAPGQGVCLRRGCWHHGLVALGDGDRFAVIEGGDYRADNVEVAAKAPLLLLAPS